MYVFRRLGFLEFINNRVYNTGTKYGSILVGFDNVVSFKFFLQL